MNVEILRAPKFVLGENYYRMDPLREMGLAYRFKSIEDNELHGKGFAPEGLVISFYDKNDREWLVFTEHGAIMRKGYAWNGCTPKVYVPVLRFWLGTPDFAATIAGSFWHDGFYQFSCCWDFPLHRSDCDDAFKQIIELNGGKKTAAVYHWAVRKFGGWDGDPSKQGEWSKVWKREQYVGNLLTV
jgi:hypothetical protein